MNERSPFTSVIRSLMRPPSSQEYRLSYKTSSPVPAERTDELKLAELRSCHLVDNDLLKRLCIHVIGRIKSMLQMLVFWLQTTFKLALIRNINRPFDKASIPMIVAKIQKMEMYQIGYLGLAHRQRDNARKRNTTLTLTEFVGASQSRNIKPSCKWQHKVDDLRFISQFLYYETIGNNYFNYKYFVRARFSPWIGAGEERSRKIEHVGVGTGETTYLRGSGTWYRAVTTSNYASYIPVKLPRSQGGQNSAQSTRRSLWFGGLFPLMALITDRSSKSSMVIRICHTFFIHGGTISFINLTLCSQVDLLSMHSS